MLNVINNWSPILPQWITDNIKQQLILPRLQVSSNMKLKLVLYDFSGGGYVLCRRVSFLNVLVRDSVMFVFSGLELSKVLKEATPLSFEDMIDHRS